MKIEKRLAEVAKYGDYKNAIKNNHSKIIRFILHPIKINFQSLPFTFATLIALIFPSITFAQLPNLGTSIDFAVFTTIGALGNTGTSYITGDIGTNDGATAGFGAPTIVSGNIESINGATAQCAIDIQTAYNELFDITPTVVNHAPSFGSGETVSAGVYAITQAGSINGDLTLDAKGNPNAIFIFKFNGAIIIGASSKINLINGASSCNVFWIAEGAISMAALTDMKGTFIASNGAISIGAGGKLEGRMLSTAGEAFVCDGLITIPICTTILPIDLLSFNGHCDNQNTVLQWSTASETNNSYFTVERSTNGINWQIVGTIIGAGNSSYQLNYTLTDIIINEGASYYRLKQTDFNGNYKYGVAIFVHKCTNNGIKYFTIFPNPTKSKFELLFDGNTSEVNTIDIFNSQGQNVYKSIGFQSMFDLLNNASGLYYMCINQNSKITRLKFILKN